MEGPRPKETWSEEIILKKYVDSFQFPLLELHY